MSSKHVPGPGAYTTVDNINVKGRYTTSKFRNSGAVIIAPSGKGSGGVPDSITIL
jgi:hypothetical protein